MSLGCRRKRSKPLRQIYQFKDVSKCITDISFPESKSAGEAISTAVLIIACQESCSSLSLYGWGCRIVSNVEAIRKLYDICKDMDIEETLELELSAETEEEGDFFP